MPRLEIHNLPNDLELVNRKLLNRIARGVPARQTPALMTNQEAKRIAEAFVRRIQDQCLRVEIAGSIRRQKAGVNDIDIVAIPKNARRFDCGIPAQEGGPGILVFEFLGAKVDLFFATPESYGVSKLIRTGSAPFNVRLCLIAKNKGWEMDFTKGLITDRCVIRSEKGILRNILDRVPEPWERD